MIEILVSSLRWRSVDLRDNTTPSHRNIFSVTELVTIMGKPLLLGFLGAILLKLLSVSFHFSVTISSIDINWQFLGVISP